MNLKGYLACVKKEWLTQCRSSRLPVLGILFAAFGIMNPAVAKLTPLLIEALSDSMAQGGMSITVGEITALDCWVQFFKNIPMALIAFVCMQGGIFTDEYRSGTLILSLTKGLPRHTVVCAKASMLVLLWTVGYWINFGITYGYSAYFWDNAAAKNLMAAVLLWWLFGLFVIALMTLFSVMASTSAAVLLGTGGVVMAFYLLGALPKIGRYMPTMLTDGNSLIYGLAEVGDYTEAIVVTVILTVACLVLSIPIMNRRAV